VDWERSVASMDGTWMGTLRVGLEAGDVVIGKQNERTMLTHAR
jgi:hypothetical protein